MARRPWREEGRKPMESRTGFATGIPFGSGAVGENALPACVMHEATGVQGKETGH